MTTDPYSAGDSQQGDLQPPQAPVYGQQSPPQPPHGHAGQQPVFGHQQPGQALPGHQQPGQPQPAYPQHQQPQPGSGQVGPGYGWPQPGDGYPHPAGYDQPQPGPGQPQPGHTQAPGYGQTPGYGQAPGPHGPSASAAKNEYFDFTDYRFRMPSSWPTSLATAAPSFRKGFGSVLQTAHMPMDARIGYWIWLVGCTLAIVSWFFSLAVIAFGVLINPFTLVATGMVGIFGGVRWGMVLLFVATMLFALVMLVVQLFMTLKLREGAEWARLGLTAITLASIVYSIILTAAGLESGGAGSVVVNILSLLMVAFFWLPKANEWFLRSTDEGTPRPGGRGPARH